MNGYEDNLNDMIRRLSNGFQVCKVYEPFRVLNDALQKLREDGCEFALEPCRYGSCENEAYYIPAARLARILGGEE